MMALRHLVASMLPALVAVPASAQASHPRTYANPIDIDYRYNFEQLNQGISYRSGADPVIVVQGGAYYLFETLGDGYWRSTDLGQWRHITPSRWPLTGVVAPAVLSVRDTIYLLPSTTRPLPILMLTHPATGQVEFYNRLLPWLPMARVSEASVLAKPDSVQPGPWDPQFFYDPDTDRWFLYWNSSNAYPLHVIELNKSKRLAYQGTPRWLFGLDPARHGWERFGRDHRDTTTHPFIEGAWMTKHAGRYYLQYGAPGTEYNVYATGVYPGDDPLGPFTYAPYNPVAYKPGGFVQGAGHGNTFQDLYGNWWNTGTPWIGVNWNFERENQPGEWLTIDLGDPYDVKAIQVNYADYQSGRFGTDSTVVTRFRLRASVDGRVWQTIADLSRERRDRPNAYLELARPVRARFMRYEHIRVGAAHFAISDIRVFGNGDGTPPVTPTGLTARRDVDERDATITWQPVLGVVGYNVRWGISPKKLYQTYQCFADQGTTLELRALTGGQAYWFAIESFDENGVSALSASVQIR
jgi:Glycosyl hydrolases family 43/F5/8 type C domain